MNKHTVKSADMWVSVIARAWDDVFNDKQWRRLLLLGNYADILESCRFLTDKSGPWSESREIICSSTLNCSDELRARAIEKGGLNILGETFKAQWSQRYMKGGALK